MRSPDTLPADRRLVDTACIRPAKCPGCGAATAAGPGGEYAMCVSCLFDLALDEAEPVAPSRNEAVDSIRSVCGRLGDYELIEEIGRGGMGVIYKALAGNGTDIVAVKALLAGTSDEIEARERFQREARAMASLRHPFIMPVHEVCLGGTTPFFSMEFAPAGSLADLLPKYHLRWRQSAQLIAQVAGAVHHAHLNGLIHRDLKPGNILFTQDLDPLVSDFGLAKWLEGTGADLTRSLVMFGTPNYVSPEQASGKHRELTPATDVYSLGAILFELLAGRPPFVGDNPLQVLQQVLAGRAPLLRSVAPALPVDLEAVCARCLQIDPHDRYASAAELADDTERWLRGERVTARLTKRGLFPTIAGAKRWQSVGAATALTVAIAGAAYLPLRSRDLGRQTTVSLAGGGAVTIEIDDFNRVDELNSFSGDLSRALASSFDYAANARLPAVHHLVASPEKVAPDAPGANHAPTSPQVDLRESVRTVGSRVRVVSKLSAPNDLRPLEARVDWLPVQASEHDFRVLVQTLHQQVADYFASRSRKTKDLDPTDAKVGSLCKKAAEFFHRMTRADSELAIVVYEGALKLQPNNASTLAGLADAYRMKFLWWGGNEEDLDRARHYAEQALAADPFSAGAHHAMGCCLIAAERYAEAREELLQELELNPDSAGGNGNLGICYRELGEPRQALPWLRRATTLDPVHGVFSMALGETYLLTGNDNQAEKEFRRASELDPEQPDAHGALVILALWQMRGDDADVLCRSFLEKFPYYEFRDQLSAEVAFFRGDVADALTRYSLLAATDTYSNGFRYFGAINPASAVAYLLQMQGKADEAARKLTEARGIDEKLLAKYPNNPRLLHDLAAIATIDGDHERALSCLAAAVSAGWPEARSTSLDPRFESLRGDQRFAEILTRAIP